MRPMPICMLGVGPPPLAPLNYPLLLKVELVGMFVDKEEAGLLKMNFKVSILTPLKNKLFRLNTLVIFHSQSSINLE